MEKPLNHDSQCQNQGENLSRRTISFLLLKVVVVVTVTLGTACILTLIFKSQKILKSAASVEAAVKPLIVQPVVENIKHIQSKGNQQVNKDKGSTLPLIKPLKTPTQSESQQATKSGKQIYSAWMANPHIAYSQPQRQKNQQLFNNQKWQQDFQKPRLALPLPQGRSRGAQVLRRSPVDAKRVPVKVAPQVALSHPSSSCSHTKRGNDILPSVPEIRGSSPLNAFSDRTRERDESISQGEPSINFKLTTNTQVQKTPAEVISQNQSQGAKQLSRVAVDNLKIEQQPSLPVQKNPTGVISQNQSQGGKQFNRVPTNNLKLEQQQSLSNRRFVALKLSDIVVLALQNNRSIKNAYLERIAQRQDLAVAEDKFTPDLTPTLSMSMAQSQSGATTTATNEIGLEAKMKIATGGELSVGWTANTLMPKIEFKQPLLRGFGIDVNTASIKTARLTEKANVLNLKSTLSNTITDAILAYRNLLRAQEQLKIEQLSLKSAQESLEINRVLIEAGRLAPVEIIQSQTAIANRQVSLVAAQNNLESVKLALLQVLDIDESLNLVAAEVPKVTPVTLDANKLRQLALENQPDYLQAQLNQDISKLGLLEAKHDRRWDLALDISYAGNTRDSATGDVRAGLNFSKTLGDLTKEQRYQRSRVNLLQAENNLKERKESLDIQVTDGIRDINLKLSQVELARQARESSERQLEIEREKQKWGRGSGVFEIVSLQNSLVEARNAELNATIEYLNALTNLDKAVGTTLTTWQVRIELNQK